MRAKAAAASVEPMGAMGHTVDMDEAHATLVAGMDTMNRDMTMGSMAKNLDVAFVCGMIPHHQGAIDMAKAELKYGNDAWVKKFAQRVIDAQTLEIAEMTQWLAQQGK